MAGLIDVYCFVEMCFRNSKEKYFRVEILVQCAVTNRDVTYLRRVFNFVKINYY